jgi:hypothetical protein
MNQQGLAAGPLETGTSTGATALTPMNRPMLASIETEGLLTEPAEDWSSPVELSATDTSNIWRTSRGAVINTWMDADRMTGWRLWVRFIDEDGQPTVLFLPFANQGKQQCGMKASQMNRSLWSFMVADAARTNPIRFQVCYRYEEMRKRPRAGLE